MCKRVDRNLGSCECVLQERVLDRVSMCPCGQSSGSCKCVYVWTEFGIV